MKRIDLAPLRWLLPYFTRARGTFTAAIVFTILGAATEPMLPALLQPLLDRGFVPGGIPLWTVPATLFAVYLLRGLSGFLADFALAATIQHGLLALRRDMFARLLDAQAGLFRRRTASALSNAVVFEVQNGMQSLVGTLMQMFANVLAVIALLGYLVWLDWKLTLIVLVMGPLVSLIMRVFSRRLYNISRRAHEATNELAYVVEENVLASRVVRLHGAQAQQAQRFDRLGIALRRLAMKGAVAGAAITPLTHMVSAMALSVVVCIALYRNGSGLSVGSFASFVAAMLLLIAPIKRLSESTGPITRGMVALLRGRELIERSPVESGGSHAPARAQGRLGFDAVTVRYDADGREALAGFSLDIAPGSVVALVGPSGSGKTTLANLLPRFVEPTEGHVLLDGRDVREWDLRALRSQFALVSQDVVMFNDTLAANIALGGPVDRERVQACVHAANLDAMVGALPQGIDTVVGHNAGTLSGGQRQRLAIARALYKDAPILILDEATSALDSESERAVQEALQRLMAGRTTLIIAHRLSTIEHADRVVVIDHGRLVEDGAHADLISRGGLYARLHALQFGETADRAG